MGRLVINSAMSVNSAFEAPSPDGWLVLDPDSDNASLDQLLLADALVLGRKTYEGLLMVSGTGELAHALVGLGLVDELWFWVSPFLWPAGPRIFDGVGPVRLELVSSTTFPAGVVRLAYRPA